MESDEVHRDRAAADLAALQADRTAMADRLRQPGWYDPALGVLVAGFFASYSFAYPWVTLAAVPVFLAALGLGIGSLLFARVWWRSRSEMRAVRA